MHLSGLTTATLQSIPDGQDGTLSTLRIMRGLVKEGKKSLRVRLLSADIVNDLDQKAYGQEAKIIQRFVRDKIRYVRDIRGIETLHTADKILEFGYGDCDDKSILVASMLESIGHKTRLVALGFRDQDFSHVYVETKIGDAWYGVETTEPVEVGWTPPKQTSRLVVYN